MLGEFLQEFHQRRNEINLYELMSLFPDFDKYRGMMKLDTVKHVLIGPTEKYGPNAKLSVRLNPKESSNDKETLEFLEKNNKVVFKKDVIDISIALSLELLAENKQGEWEVFRTGYAQFGASSNITYKREHTVDRFVFSKLTVGFRKLKLFDPEIEDEEDKEMSNEAGAIFGVANLGLKSLIPKDLVLETPFYYVPELSPDHIHFNVWPGFVYLGYTEFEPDVYPIFRHL